MWTNGTTSGASPGNLDDLSQPSQPSSASSAASPRRTSTGISEGPHASSTSSLTLRKRKRLVVSCEQCHRRKQKCDRNQPCKACVSRGMAGSCRYETPAMSRERHNMRISEATVAPGSSYPPHQRPAKAAKMMASMSSEDYGYAYSTNGHTDAFQQNGTSWYLPQFPSQFQPGLSTHAPLEIDPKLVGTCTMSTDPTQAQPFPDHYTAQVRMLPRRVAVDRLVDLYFAKMHWQHGILDEDVFRKQLADWYGSGGGGAGADDGQSPMQTISPQTLSHELRVFPALLFLVLSTALLGLEADAEAERTFFESIKNPANVIVKDLAKDYGSSGMRLLSVLGKRVMTLETVQTSFLWTAFLLDTASIMQSYTALEYAIRDAQDIGLHNSSLDPRPHAQTPAAVFVSQWEVQRRRHLWMMLVAWDLSLAALLGRPPTADLDSEPVLPVDCVLPKTFAERAQMPVQPRDEADAPTLVTRALWAYTVAAPLRGVLKLLLLPPQPDGSDRRQDRLQVAALDVQLAAVEAGMPAPFRATDPETRFDDEPGCTWLPAVRSGLAQACAFARIALHRPYILQRAKSRTEVLKACVRLLSLQRACFAMPRAKRGCMSVHFHQSFDALVLVAVLYILFPSEHPELLPDVCQHFRRSAEQLEAFVGTLSSATPALDVLQTLNLRLRKALDFDFMEVDSAGLGGLLGPAAAAVGSAPVDALTLSNIDPSLKEEGAGTTAGDGAETTGTVAVTRNGLEGKVNGAQEEDLQEEDKKAEAEAEVEEEEEGRPALFPDDVDRTTVPPLCPTGDLVNVALGVSDGAVMPLAGASPGLFTGVFGGNSLWAVLNTYAYAPFAEERAAAWPA